MANTPNITTERMIALGIRLLEALTAAPHQTLDINDAAGRYPLGRSAEKTNLISGKKGGAGYGR